MFSNKRKMKHVIVYSAGYSVAGVIIMSVILFFGLIAGQYTVSLTDLPILFRDHKEFYLIRLIPLVMGIAGAIEGRKISETKQRVERKILYYESVLKKVIDFVRQIESNNLNKPFIPINGEKVLESAMESMRISLISASRREFERNEINRISNETSLLLQSFNDENRLSDETIAFLVNKLDNVVQGAFYSVEEESDKEKVIVMKAAYAYNRKRHLNKGFRFAEGLIGQAAIEKDIILRTEIPDNYVTITSGLIGHKKPKSILISPLIVNDIVYGVIELASIRNFTTFQCNLIQDVSKIIGRSLANLKINLKTYSLLNESEKMSTELKYQEKKLLENADDLIMTQEELKRSNSMLEDQIQEVHNTNKRSNVLLENAREVITIISEERKILYVSPSVKSILGYFPEELLGKNDLENLHPLDTEKFNQFLRNLISYPEKELKLQYRYFTKDGEVLWMEAMGKNLISDKVIKGIVVNSSDISEQRSAAREQRIRAKMQSLSENSSDLIIRVDVFGRCTYINPVIELYTGVRKDAYLNKPIGNTELYPSVVTILKQLLEEVCLKKVKKTTEMDFPLPGGNRIMHVNAIPEFNDLGDAESVLYACHDITESKAREELIRKKNKSISDSINYALNIQSAIMPTEDDIRKILPNSFMFYKPKDVVSGDYPCLYRKGDSVYIGAMDCTGHGVPGALMSIIGYFLQDTIFQGNKELNASDVLNKLHSKVVDKLKQAEPASKINDGMDAALCKINLKKGELHFAGAHRPLYYVSKNIITEFKGDKFPVGSTQYRNRKDFINHTIKIKHGDAIYFMTDGFHDQFGGPTGKQRFTREGVENLIRENTHLSIFQMGILFRDTYEKWKAAVNQLDDVLVIGIRF